MDRNFLCAISPTSDLVWQVYVFGFNVCFRLFELSTYADGQAAEDEFITEEQLNSFASLLNKPLKHNNKTYWCRFSKVSIVDEQIWQPYKEVYMLVKANYPYTSSVVAFIDKSSETYLSQMAHAVFNERFKVWGSRTVIRFLVLPGTNLETAPKVCTPNHEFITNLTFDSSYDWDDIEAEFGDKVTEWKEYWIPKVKVTGSDTIKANEYEEFTLKAFSQGDQLCLDDVCYYVEPIQGYAPNREIKMVEGEGKFKVGALGLEPGDKLRFKINSKYWADKTEKVLTVI